MNFPDAPTPPRSITDDYRELPFRGWWPIIVGAVVGVVLRLLFSAGPGYPYSTMMGSFVFLAPVLVGAITVYLAERRERRTWKYYVWAPALATVLFVCGTLLILVEGWICAIVIIPLFAMLGIVGGVLMGIVCRTTQWPRRNIVSGIALLPLLTGGFEHKFPLTDRVRTAEREILIDASARDVWRQLVHTPNIQPHEVEEAWMYRIGVPLPLAGVADRDGDVLQRHITMGKGIHFEQVSSDWQENDHVRWEYRFAPNSVPPRALDDHVRIGGDYFDLLYTEYSLSEVSGGTLLRVSTRYRVSTRFNWYAGPVADLLVGDLSEVFLRFYARRASEGLVP